MPVESHGNMAAGVGEGLSLIRNSGAEVSRYKSPGTGVRRGLCAKLRASIRIALGPEEGLARVVLVSAASLVF